MANSKGSSNFRNLIYAGKNPLLPPKSPFPCVAPSYADYVPNPSVGTRSIPIQKPREGYTHHQRTSSESVLIEEQPSWLDDLLNEPETPVRRGGHRRSSSDSFAYIDATNASNIDYTAQDDYKFRNLISVPSWQSQELDHYRDSRHASYYAEPNSIGKPKSRVWDSPLKSSVPYLSAPSSGRDNTVVLNACAPQDADRVPSTASEKQDLVESGPNDPKASSERRDFSSAKSSASETDTKRAKQQFAQRSRVRKLQYIAELERNVQALQAEGSGVSAELEFLNQQNLILSMENKALKQRLESLAQEQLIKYLEQEVLEREIGRLRGLYQQQVQKQQQPPQQQQQGGSSSSHRRSSSRGGDIDSQFANLSLKHKDASSSRDPVLRT